MILPTMSALFHLLEAVNSLLKVRVPQAIQGARKVVDSHPKSSKAPIREATLSFLNLVPLFRLSEFEISLSLGVSLEGRRQWLARLLRFDYSDLQLSTGYKDSQLWTLLNGKTTRPPIPMHLITWPSGPLIPHWIHVSPLLGRLLFPSTYSKISFHLVHYYH